MPPQPHHNRRLTDQETKDRLVAAGRLVNLYDGTGSLVETVAIHAITLAGEVLHYREALRRLAKGAQYRTHAETQALIADALGVDAKDLEGEG